MNTTSKTKAFALALSAVCALQSFAAETSLPAGYTRLEWLASTADTPYIDTGYTPTSTDKFTVRFRSLSNAKNYEVLYCARGNGGGSFTCFRNNTGTGLRFDYNGGTHGYSPSNSTNTEYILVADGNIAAGNTATSQYSAYTLNGNVQALSTTTDRAGTFTIKKPLRLFATDSGTLPGRFRIYYFRVENSAGVLQADLRPCRRNSDGTLGMYDLVRETFCPAGGTGSFETNETGLPPGYSAREWIQSSGTQWVNTEFTPLCFDSVSTTFRFRALPSGNFAVFCARKDGKQTFTFLRVGSTFRFDHNAGNKTATSSVSPVVNTDYTITMNGTTLVGTVNGGNDVAFNDAGNFTVGSPMTLFAAHNGTIADANMSMKSSLRLFSFTVTDSATGTVLCDLLPCVRSLDNEAGLYDRINKRFLTNGGTGEFKVPIYSTFITFR